MTKKEVINFNMKNVCVGISSNNYGRTYFAKKDFNVGEEIMRGWGKVIDHQTPHISVQIEVKKHYLPKKWTGRYWNHSCGPNAYIKTRSDGFPSLFALKKIKKGEEITYNYSMTEYAWIKNADENRVKCACGQKNCKNKIYSFSQLTRKKQDSLRKNRLCSKYLQYAKIN